MKPYECVIAPKTGHINVHEAGAIEATGHKVEGIETKNGKLTPELIEPLLIEREDDHMVKPKVNVSISNSTEVGTIYTKPEIIALSEFCKKKDLYLYLDGARLASGITAKGSDLTLEDLAKYTDMFYIGGTKNGALLGEAMVINNEELKKDFFRNVKQKGALLAKGRLLGIQFSVLLKNDLYFSLGKNANVLAEKLTEGISKLGFNFLTDSTTNQIFPIFPNALIEKLQELYGFYIWSKIDEENSAIRLVTSWATKEENVSEFLNDLEILSIIHERS